LNQSGFVQFAENNKRHLKELDDFLRDNKQLRVTVVTLHLGIFVSYKISQLRKKNQDCVMKISNFSHNK
jgi:predicted negative regulator of RcsB-dependent stress response